MKNIIAIAATILTGLVAFPEKAEAGHASVSFTYQSGRSSCGCPTYTKRYFSGYDCHRRPIYRYVSVPVVHRCSHHAHRPHVNHYIHSRSQFRPAPHYSNRSHYSRNQYYRSSRSHGSFRRGGSCR